MTTNFTRVTRRPTPDELLAKLQAIVPGFRAAWQKSMFLTLTNDE